MFFISFISSVDIELTKSSYYPEETLQAEISGSFISSIKIENIAIYGEGKSHEEPSIEGIVKLGTKYLYYSSLPLTPGNYYLKINDVSYYSNNLQTDLELNKSFTIKSTNSSYLSFTPGFFYGSNDMTLYLKAYNKEQSVSVEFSPTNFKQTFNLGYGEEKTIFIPITSLTESVDSEVKVDSYSIPVSLIINSAQNNNSNNDNESDEEDLELSDIIELNKDSITATLMENTDYFYTIELINTESKEINLDIDSNSNYVTVKPSELEDFDDKAEINITINSKKSFNSTITLSYGDSNIIIPIEIKITKEQASVNFTNNLPLNQVKTCVELGGRYCDSSKNEICTRSLAASNSVSSNLICCSVPCTIKKTSSSSWIWGLLLLVLLGVGAWFLYNKSKEDNSESFKKETISKRIEQFRSRINPNLEGKEVNKNLSKD